MAAQKGYRLILVVPGKKMSREKVCHLKALGAEVVMTRSDVGRGHPRCYQDARPGADHERNAGTYYVNQFNNPANPLAHEKKRRGRRFLGANRRRVDAIVCWCRLGRE